MDLQTVTAKALEQSPKPKKSASDNKSRKNSLVSEDTFVRSDAPNKKQLKVYTKADMLGTKAISAPHNNQATKLKASIEIEVEKQTTALLQQFSARLEIDIEISAGSLFGKENKDALRGLRDHFERNPAAMSEIEQGNIPPYFNVENTGKRMMDILLAGVAQDNITEAWVKDKKAMVDQAYAEVSDMLGKLPEIVLRTRDYVFSSLDEMLSQ